MVRFTLHVPRHHLKFSPDIRFPTLPGWYTRALRARERKKPSIHFPEGSLRMTEPIPLSPPPTPPPFETLHDHALLESLYQSVYETRFINLAPTGKHFDKVQAIV